LSGATTLRVDDAAKGVCLRLDPILVKIIVDTLLANVYF
jgi:hypothetical protein